MLTNTTFLQPHMFATVDSLTARGGRVATATSESNIWGKEIACVGDIVAYPNGEKATIVDGVSFPLMSSSKLIAFVGSLLSNGDRIVEMVEAV
ncbi:PAAR motif-containing protein [Paraburkholderia sp. RAU2J]|uniref:PAAR domain-containing protein n=1 Tax=unclassified Paraburkholderia TaxID=2615204 RepID=UPI000EAD21B3|nr:MULTISPECIES: PAAR domain-containing protein [unclassified Paraburkholderia]NKJ48659.1 hypothetical protein [Paraburkholderia sp. SG-MS1]RKT13725.1 PAAR motif-containing protein [Paraburkholderia sp. RAU2J]